MHFADLYDQPIPASPHEAASSVEAVLRTLRRLRADGVTEVALTPALHPPAPWTGWTLQERVAEMRADFEAVRAASEGRHDLPLLHPGARVQVLDRAELLSVLEHPRAGLGGARTLLLDFGVGLWGRPERVIGCARAAGYQVVVAHPERYPFASPEEAVARARRWRDLGAFLQARLESVTMPAHGAGGEVGRLAWRLLEEGLVHLLASGACEAAPRPDQHRLAFGRLAANGAEEQATRLLGENPRRLLRGLPALPVRPVRAPRLAA